MKTFIYIECDENDADYRSSLCEITPETLEAIRPVIDAIRAYTSQPDREWGDYNYLTGERVGEGDSAEKMDGEVPGWEEWNEFVPFAEYGFHTVSEIKIFHVESVENLLDS